MTPPPGCVAAPQRYRFLMGVLYCAHPGSGRMNARLLSDIVPCMMLPPVSPKRASMSRGDSTWRLITDFLKFGAYSLRMSKQRSANFSFAALYAAGVSAPFTLYGKYWMNID